MEIPKTFRLGRMRYKVLQPDTVPYGRVGDVHYKPGIIRVAWYKKDESEPRSRVQRSETFWHETTHAILHDMGHKLWRDEKFVTDFSKRLNQVVHTARL